MIEPETHPLVPYAGGWSTVGLEASRRLARRLGRAFLDKVEELTGEDIEARLEALRVHQNEAGFDPFGWDPEVARYALASAALLHRLYFRTEVHGAERVPPRGRLLVVANHAGQLPFDGMVLAATLILDVEPPRLPRSMVERWSAQLPFVSVFFPRTGQVVGSPENARRLLQREETIIVFPEGSRGISKPITRRYRLEPFGLGFMRLALETRTPILPVAIVGSEEQYVSVANLKRIAGLLGMPALPIVPQLALGLWAPLPVKYRLYFGEPMHFEGDPDDEDDVVERKVWAVRTAIERMLEQGLARRKRLRDIFF